MSTGAARGAPAEPPTPAAVGALRATPTRRGPGRRRRCRPPSAPSTAQSIAAGIPGAATAAGSRVGATCAVAATAPSGGGVRDARRASQVRTAATSSGLTGHGAAEASASSATGTGATHGPVGGRLGDATPPPTPSRAAAGSALASSAPAPPPPAPAVVTVTAASDGCRPAVTTRRVSLLLSITVQEYISSTRLRGGGIGLVSRHNGLCGFHWFIRGCVVRCFAV